MRSIWQLVSSAFRSFGDDDCPDRAAIIAYYALFSIFPLLLGLIALAGFVLQESAVQAQVLGAMAHLLPGSIDLLSTNLEGIVAARGTIGVVSLVGLLWSATSVFSAIRRALNLAWNVESERPLVAQKLLELGLVFGVGLLVLGSVVATAIFDLAWALLPPALQFVTGFGHTAVANLLPVALSYASFLVLYRLIPNTRVEWADIWLGALVAAFLFEAAKRGFGWYLTHFANYSEVYGSLGAVIAFLFWAYVSALILLFGAELAAEHARMRAAESHHRLALLAAAGAGPAPNHRPSRRSVNRQAA